MIGKVVKIVAVWCGLCCCLLGQAQDVPNFGIEPQKPKSNPFRKALSIFHLNIASGYGQTYLKHELTGVGILSKSNGDVYLFDRTNTLPNDTLNLGIIDWINDPVGINGYITDLGNPVNGIPITDTDFLVNTDTALVIYKGKNYVLPIDVNLQIRYLKFRVGGGYMFELTKMGNLRPKFFNQDLSNADPNLNFSNYRRWYGTLGYEAWHRYRNTVVVDAKVGTVKFGKQYNDALITRTLFFNLGVTMERAYSEYVKLFIRPSYEFKAYSIDIPQLGVTINNTIPALYLNAGLSISLANLKRCPVNMCNTQIDHAHAGKGYRSKMHPFWKWQNPNYGQNFPVPNRVKGKNKRRIQAN